MSQTRNILSHLTYMVYAPASKIGIQWVGINICLVTYYLHHYRVTYDGVDQSLSYFE